MKSEVWQLWAIFGGWLLSAGLVYIVHQYFPKWIVGVLAVILLVTFYGSAFSLLGYGIYLAIDGQVPDLMGLKSEVSE